MPMYTVKKKGFTLIELLIVITIIGILAVTLVPRLTGGRDRAKDASRKADLQQIATSLEFYANDNSGEYPAIGTLVECVDGTTVSAALEKSLTSIPSDPGDLSVSPGSACTDNYIYYPLDADGDSFNDGYLLMAELENEKDGGEAVYEKPNLVLDLSDTDDASTNLARLSACSSDCVYIIGR